MVKAGEIGMKQLLGRGGRILGLAAVARSRGQRAGQGPWYVLSADLVAASEEVLHALESEVDSGLLEAAVNASMSEAPTNRAPAWARLLAESPRGLSALGRKIDGELIRAAHGAVRAASSDLIDGLAALAVAFARHPDTLRAMAELLDPGHGRRLIEMGCLASACVEPGVPSRVRAEVKQFVKELDGDGDQSG